MPYTIWLIGAGLLGPAVHADALRSLKAPGTAYDAHLGWAPSRLGWTTM